MIWGWELRGVVLGFWIGGDLEYFLAGGGNAAPASGLSSPGSGGIGQQLRRHFGRHGERGNVLSELWLFRPAWWRGVFHADGFEIVQDEPVGIFYSGNTGLGTRLPIDRHTALPEWLARP